MPCTVTAPLNMNGLTAASLSQKWTVDGCRQGTVKASTFMECTIIDTATGALSVYSPLLVQNGQQTLPTVVPDITPTSVIGCFFGSNADTVVLADRDKTSLKSANCVNGDPNTRGDTFGQFASCNGQAFFEAANAAIAAGKLKVPLPGVGTTGHVCYHTRSFEVVDADPNDNVLTTYLVSGGATTIAQNTKANKAKMGAGATVVSNGSDEALKDNFFDRIFGCTSWKVPNLADPGEMVGSLALNELQSAAAVAASVAMGASMSQFASVPVNDPMVTIPNPVNKLAVGTLTLSKLNAYRVHVNQPPLTEAEIADKGRSFCQGMNDITAHGLILDAPYMENVESPDPTAGDSLKHFLAGRFQLSWNKLGCSQLLNKPSPITAQLNGLIAVGMNINDPELQALVGSPMNSRPKAAPPSPGEDGPIMDAAAANAPPTVGNGNAGIQNAPPPMPTIANVPPMPTTTVQMAPVANPSRPTATKTNNAAPPIPTITNINLPGTNVNSVNENSIVMGNDSTNQGIDSQIMAVPAVGQQINVATIIDLFTVTAAPAATKSIQPAGSGLSMATMAAYVKPCKK